jgi:dephospho-CoA kinase
MLRVGLTGGLASGKSTVAAFFRKLGALHVDGDRIARELTARHGGAVDEIVARFGPAVVAKDGTIDRKALAALVFADPQELAALNAILHPRIRAEIERRIAENAASPSPAPIAIIDAALLVESGFAHDLDALVVLSCRPETQIARAVARGGLTESEARARIAAQAPLAAKLSVADHVIDTETSLAETKRRVRAVWDGLLRDRRSGD